MKPKFGGIGVVIGPVRLTLWVSGGSPVGMTKCLLLLALAMLAPVRALVPGAWEQFSTKVNADGWTAEAYYYDNVAMDWLPGLFYPGWSDGADPFIGFTMSWGSVYLFADAAVAEGAFTGDYAAADVEWITMDIAVGDASLIDYYDVAILSDVGGVERYYYTDSFTVEDFQDFGWEPLAISLADTWYYWDPTIEGGGEIVGGWVGVTLSDTMLSNITEIGITFFHRDQSGTDVDVMIDNVALSHPLVEPELSVSGASGVAAFSFQPLPAHEYDLEQFNATTEAWAPVAGQTGILGPDPLSFAAPGGGGGVFRCVAEPYYTSVVTAPSS